MYLPDSPVEWQAARIAFARLLGYIKDSSSSHIDSFEHLEKDFRQQAHPPATHFAERAARFLDLFPAIKIWAVFAQLRVGPADHSSGEQTNCNFKSVYSSNPPFDSLVRDSDAGVASARS